jgi:hypothetical protein
LGDVGLPRFAVSGPKDNQDRVFVKVASSMKDCSPIDLYGTVTEIADMQCAGLPRQLQVFKSKTNCSSWFAAHKGSSLRYVCGPSWVVQVSNVEDEISVAAETGGLPEPLPTAGQPASDT